MSNTQTAVGRATPVPLPAEIHSVQPGGGVCYRIELAWGRLRRRYLNRFRRGYVEKMARLREGDVDGCPHEILDPRDLKYCRNQCTARWRPADDPYAWREKIPFARWGLAELQLIGYPLAAVTVALIATYGATPWPLWLLAIVPAVLLFLVVYFFRDPPRQVPSDAGLVIAPADGKVMEVVELDYDEFIGGPAVRIGVFLSLVNVHVNRAPLRSRVIEMKYSPGKFLSALDPASALENESMWIGLEEEDPPHRLLSLRQIAGRVARRIVCDLRPGQVVQRGEKFGMIKLGSRTELVLPRTGDLQVETAAGRRIKAGRTILARYANEPEG
jgi:phosphatidylserine decarboxylase